MTHDMTPADMGVVERLERELGAARAEIARLARLLDLRGRDTAPAPEQLAVPAPALVTNASPNPDKLALYADRFRARTDVYARRYENRWTGKSGWTPTVVGGWRKGMKHESASYLPLTPEVIKEHFWGNIFIGFYPLLADNTCYFLVADFDGKPAMLDALAYAKAARTNGVPAALEISQSGGGAHVWVFFTEKIPASTARSVGTTLIHEAMVLRGSMDLRSYDRLFPSQDVLSGSGLGNLIAAPLQGRRKANGLTLFLDPATLEPYDDQWLFLSTLDRLSPGDAQRVARLAKRTLVGNDVTTMSRSDATRVQPPMPPVVRAELGAGLVLDLAELPAAAVSTFKHAASVVNPKFYELQRLRKSTWDTPRFIRGYDITLDDKLLLPRGLRHTVTQIVDRAGSRLTLADGRNPGREIDVTFNAHLRPEQAIAVGAMLGHDNGILVAPPGEGKTVMACAIIAERATSTLVLLDRKTLAEQWRARIQQLLGIKAGQLGGGRTKLTGVVDIAMLPTLAARRDEIGELTRPYGQIIVDECHHLAAGTYDDAVKRVGAQFWLGLTATPDRRDGLGELITWQLGPVRHTLAQSEPGTLMDALRDVTGPRRMLHIQDTSFRYADIDPTAPGALAEVHSALVTDRTRNAQLAGDIDAALARGRNCLVLVRRIAHLDALASLLAEREPIILQGGMTAIDRRTAITRLADTQAGDGVLVLGTTPFIGEGFDAPALDTLFLAAPISFDGLLIQCAGRVLRAAPGKDVAEVYDYHDPAVPVLAASLQRRMPGYRALGFAKT
jgi:superfamily II DNA or RNA helicase